MAAKKKKVDSPVTVNSWALMHRCVDEGVERGWARAHKHTDTPEGYHIQDEISSAVKNALGEYFNFPYEPMIETGPGNA